VVVCLEQGADCLHMIQLMTIHHKTPSLVLLKSILVLPFWYQLTQAVLEKRPLNGCSVEVYCKKTRWVAVDLGTHSNIGSERVLTLCE